MKVDFELPETSTKEFEGLRVWAVAGVVFLARVNRGEEGKQPSHWLYYYYSLAVRVSLEPFTKLNTRNHTKAGGMIVWE